MNINLHIYPSPFKNESRIIRETNSIINLKLADKVYIAATFKEGLALEENITNEINVVRFKTFWNRFSGRLIFDILKFISFMFSAFFRFSKKQVRPKIVNCHSLSVLPLGIAFKLVFGAKLIYDAHELETERAGLKGIKQTFSKILEKTFIHFVDKTIVVSSSIEKWYRNEYKISDIYTIRNVPDIVTIHSNEDKKDIFRRLFNIPKDEVIFIYQGLLSHGRGLDILLKSFIDTTNSHHLIIMGYGKLQSHVEKFADQYPNIHFKPAVAPHEIIDYTRSADVGISLIENIGLSYYYCLPNKIFEYTLSGIPILASNFPDMSEFILQNNNGWLIEPSTSDLTEFLNRISVLEVLDIKKTNCVAAAKNIGWHIEENILPEVYNFSVNPI